MGRVADPHLRPQVLLVPAACHDLQGLVIAHAGMRIFDDTAAFVSPSKTLPSTMPSLMFCKEAQSGLLGWTLIKLAFCLSLLLGSKH